MANNGIQMFPLQDRSDEHASRFRAPDNWRSFLGEAAVISVISLHPGHTAGNHYHMVSREVMIVTHTDNWSLYYDSGPGTEVIRRQFQGKGAILLAAECMSAHTIINDGSSDLHLIAIFNRQNDPEHPDNYPRRIV